MFLKFADWLVYGILELSSETSLGEAIHFFIYDATKILFLLFAIISAIALLRSYIDNDKFKNYIEKRPKFIAHLLAAIFGAVTPFCSCSSIPLFIGFMEAKIPFGIAMSFLITSPMINEIAILVLVGIVGLKVTVLYVATGIVVGMIGGYIMGKFGYEKYLQDYLKVIADKTNSNTTNEGGCCSCGCDKKAMTIKERLFDAFDYTKDLMKRIWLFVLLGVGVGAFLHGYIPQEFFMKYLGTGNLFAVPMAVTAGIPLYADVTSIIPIAQVLIDKGAAVGTVLVFMMAVVGLSLPEIIIISRVFKKELIIRFVIFMFITFTIVGYFYNAVLQ